MSFDTKRHDVHTEDKGRVERAEDHQFPEGAKVWEEVWRRGVNLE